MESESPNIFTNGHPEALTSQALQNSLSFLDDAPAKETVLGFHIGNWGFLLPISLHCEVLEATQVNPIPKVEPWFSGLLNIRGNIAPVVDLHLLPNNTAIPPKKRYLFAIDRGDKTMVLWIDDYPQMFADVSDPLADLPSLPAELLPCIRTAHHHQDKIWFKVQFEDFFKTLGIRQPRQETTP